MTINYELNASEMERMIDDPDPGFLDHLAPSEAIPNNPYFGLEQFLQIFEQEYYNFHDQSDHWFLLAGVTQRVFEESSLKAESGSFSHAFAYYPYFHRLLVATRRHTDTDNSIISANLVK